MKNLRLLFICFLIVFGIASKAQNPLALQLNKYQFFVVKEENSISEYKDVINKKVIESLKGYGFPNPTDQSVLYSTSFDQSKVITLSYSVLNPSNTSGEVQFSFKFINYKYETVFSNSIKDKYQFLNEKNYFKTITKCFSILDGYQYKYEGSEGIAVKNPEKTNSTRSESSIDAGELHASSIDFANAGKYYALIIGVSDYTDPNIPDLDSLPVKDAINLSKVLMKNYTFEKENVTLLKNPTRRDIVIALDELSKKTTTTDNVLIFYAGHGHYEDENGIGYWFPKDAEVSNSSNWLYNNQLVDCIKKIKSLHTLLISDACFSGSIFKTRSVDLTKANDFIKKKYQLASRKAITSGTLKTVPNVSIFIKYLLKNLNENQEKYLTSSQLFQSLEAPVGNNAPSVPQFGVIQNVGDEGGDFIFIRKDSAPK
jgi:hypothetical protein